MVQEAKVRYIKELANDFSRLYEANEQHRAYLVLKEVLRMATGDPNGNNKKQDNSIKSSVLKAHYEKLFDAKEAELKMPVQYSRLQRDEYLTLEKLNLAIRKMSNGKAPGISGVRAELIKYGGIEIRESLVRTLNQYWNGVVAIPREWLDAEVISIYKRKGSRKEAANYRSIFLLDVVGKIYLAMVCNRIIPSSDGVMA